MHTPEKPRIKDIANKLGISSMSVSVALRDMPGVSEKTRNRVKQCAREMGYQPDPALSALADYRRRQRPGNAYSQIAYITNYELERDSNWAFTQEYLVGAKERGKVFGYEVVPFWLRADGMNPKQASSVLFNRGIKGLLIAPLPEEYGRLDMTWKYFVSVAIGTSLVDPELDQLTFDHHRAMQLAVQKLRNRGYRRIGLAMLRKRSARLLHESLDTFLGEHYRDKVLAPIPPLLPKSYTADLFWDWFDIQKPDAIISDCADEILALLKRRNIKIPQQLGVASYCRLPIHDQSVSAVTQDLQAIGAAAVDRLHTNLLRNLYGTQNMATSTLIRGTWDEGKTLRKRKPTSRNKTA
tara:strand:+ start:1558 stop:2616 length:1059 start_codon:yes stop_codon:yes gene_type:complete